MSCSIDVSNKTQCAPPATEVSCVLPARPAGDGLPEEDMTGNSVNSSSVTAVGGTAPRIQAAETKIYKGELEHETPQIKRGRPCKSQNRGGNRRGRRGRFRVNDNTMIYTTNIDCQDSNCSSGSQTRPRMTGNRKRSHERNNGDSAHCKRSKRPQKLHQASKEMVTFAETL